MRGARRLLAGLATLVVAADAYLLVLLGAATGARRRARPDGGLAHGSAVFTVLVPAHDEERTLPAALASLGRLQGRERARVVVVADNCTDRTAQVARAAGAEVLERSEPSRPGKGPAIAWAIEQLQARRWLDRPLVFVDADCEVSPNLLVALERHLAAGTQAAQVDNAVANPHESQASALRTAAFLLVNTVRASGRSALGISVGLSGTGVMLTPDILHRVPWRDFGLAEDLEYGLRLAAAGERVVFVPEARVTSRMPTAADAATSQQMRWEAGKLAAARKWTPRLVSAAVRRRDPRIAAVALEVLIPPQAVLLLSHGSLSGVAAAVRARTALRLALIGTLAQTLYIVGGLALVRAPAPVWLGLAGAPRLVLAKAALVARLAHGGAPTRWVRTRRDHDGGGSSYPESG